MNRMAKIFYDGDDVDKSKIFLETSCKEPMLMIFHYFMIVMIAAPSKVLPRSDARAKWVDHWFGGAIPNLDDRLPLYDYHWNWNNHVRASAPDVSP